MASSDSFYNTLIDLAYTFFPKGINENNPEYFNSKEHQNLIAGLEKKADFEKMFLDISSEVTSFFQRMLFEDLSFNLVMDRCVKGKFFYEEEDNYIMVYISIIIPFYVIYEANNILSDKNLGSFDQTDHIWKENSPTFIRFKEVFQLIVNNQLPEYEKLDFDLAQTEVDDILFNGNGRLASFKHQRFSSKMTLFNAFFSDNYF